MNIYAIEKDIQIIGIKANKSLKVNEGTEEKKEIFNVNDNLYINFDINKKQLILKINYLSESAICLCMLDDGRLVSSSSDSNIIIYNKITYKPDIRTQRRCKLLD